jgi:lipoic acid synthetase
MARAVVALKRRNPDILVETLTGDFAGHLRDIDTMLASGPDVFAHNIEVTRRLTPVIRDRRCGYERSLGVLRHAKERAPDRLVKSSIMVGIGETDDEVVETLADLRAAGVDVVTIGQYLRPTAKHAPVDRYVTPDCFDELQRVARTMGFAFVASGPLVRSSYHAAEAFVASRLQPTAGGAPGPVPEASAVGGGLLHPSALLRRAALGKNAPPEGAGSS